MPRPNKKFTHAILLGLMLIMGSVQAQVSYFCGMMDTVVHDTCCCADSDADEMMSSDREPCCDKSVKLMVDTATDHGQPNTKPVKFESDVDPPCAVTPAVDFFANVLDLLSACGADHGETKKPVGRLTYLLTQRLRI